MASFQDGAIFLGNSVSFSDTILQADGVTPYNLTNATVAWIGKLFDNQPANVFSFSQAIGPGVSSGRIQAPAPTNGIITALSLFSTDTFWSAMLPWALLYLYVNVTDSSGNLYTTKKFTARLQV